MNIIIGQDKQKMSVKLSKILSSINIKFVLGAQKNRLIETVLLSTHNICFCSEIRKMIFDYVLLTKGLDTIFEIKRAHAPTRLH